MGRHWGGKTTLLISNHQSLVLKRLGYSAPRFSLTYPLASRKHRGTHHAAYNKASGLKAPGALSQLHTRNFPPKGGNAVLNLVFATLRVVFIFHFQFNSKGTSQTQMHKHTKHTNASLTQTAVRSPAAESPLRPLPLSRGTA